VTLTKDDRFEDLPTLGDEEGFDEVDDRAARLLAQIAATRSQRQLTQSDPASDDQSPQFYRQPDP
jgi:hypothetical protein